MRTHTGEWPFQCSVCSIGFSLKGTLKGEVHPRYFTISMEEEQFEQCIKNRIIKIGEGIRKLHSFIFLCTSISGLQIDDVICDQLSIPLYTKFPIFSIFPTYLIFPLLLGNVCLGNLFSS